VQSTHVQRVTAENLRPIVEAVVQCHRLVPGLAKWHAAKKLLMKLVDKGLLKRVSTGTKLRSRAYFVLAASFSTRR